MPVALELAPQIFLLSLLEYQPYMRSFYLLKRVRWMRCHDGRVLSVRFNSSSQQIAVDWGNCSGSVPSVSVNSFRFSIYFKPEERLASDSSELKASCLSFDLLGAVLGPTMLKVTFGYLASENDFFWWDCHFLMEFEFEAFDNRLKTRGLVVWKLQWQSESTAEMNYSQWHWGAIWWALLFLTK